MVFLEAETGGLFRLAADNRDQRSAHSGDLPPEISASRLPRAVNAHDPVFHLRHNAIGTLSSFFTDMFHAILDSKKYLVSSI